MKQTMQNFSEGDSPTWISMKQTMQNFSEGDSPTLKCANSLSLQNFLLKISVFYNKLRWIVQLLPINQESVYISTTISTLFIK